MQMSEGATYGVVPYVNRRCTGTIAGIVGAGGNIGGVTCAIIFKTMATPYEVFQIIGAMIGVAAMCVLLIKVDGSYALRTFTKGRLCQQAALQPEGGQASFQCPRVGLRWAH
jgi:nitrate/nitrite transporter NarK